MKHPRLKSNDRLFRALGLAFGLAVMLGNTVGSGIFRAPGTIAARLPAPGLIALVWAAGGAYALLSANALAELGTMLPRSGAQYVYVRHALGAYPGFVVGWSDWLAQCGGTAALAIVIADSLGALVPGFAPYALAVAIMTVLVFTVLLWHGVRWSDRIQGATSVLKAMAFVALLVACFAFAHRATTSGPRPLIPAGGALFTGLVVAFQAVIFTYDGWAGVLYFSEEIHDPGRNIPRALFLGLALIVALYVLVNAALLTVLPISVLGQASVAVAAAARVIAGARGDQVMHTLVVVTLVSAVTANLLMASRVSFALARDGFLPRAGARVNAGGTPGVALGASATVAVAFLLSGTFETVIAVLAIFFVLEYTLSFLSLFVLRQREPAAFRPWRAWGHPWTTGLVLGGSVVFLVAAAFGDPGHSIAAACVLGLSYPIYRLGGMGRAARVTELTP